MSVEVITSEDRHRAVATRLVDGAAWWEARYIEAMERVRAPGDHDEVADTGEASIEWGARNKVSVFVSHWEEAVEYSPDEARALAFNLLALADLVERAQPDQPKEDS